jgi:RHS repeat-associated protein
MRKSVRLAALVIALMIFTARARSNPTHLVTWSDLDSLVVQNNESSTNWACMFPPGLFTFGISGGYYTFAADGELAAATNLFVLSPEFGVPVWTLRVTETQCEERVWLYAGADAGAFRTNPVPTGFDPQLWVRSAYGDPPLWLSASELDEWYGERNRSRMWVGLSLVSSNDWPLLAEAWHTAATNAPSPAHPPTLPPDTNRLAFAGIENVSSNSLRLWLYSPTAPAPIDVFSCAALPPPGGLWSLVGMTSAGSPFSVLDTAETAGSAFYHIARGDVDSDGDGIADGRELLALGTDPLLADTDGDGLSDRAEMYRYETDPSWRDSDNDGFDDGWEIANGMNPLDAADGDSDGDGLLNAAEISVYGTDPFDPDSDEDRLTDGEEIAHVEKRPAGPWFDVSGGSSLMSALSYNLDDGHVTAALPFPVFFDGSFRSNVVVNVNGLIWLLTPGESFPDDPTFHNNDDWLTAYVNKNHVLVAGYWDDLYAYTAALGSVITMADVVTNGSRYCVIEYRNMGFHSSSYPPTNHVVSFQIVLPQAASNRVDVNFQKATGMADGHYASLGFQDAGAYQRVTYSHNVQGKVFAGLGLRYGFSTETDPLDPDCDKDGLLDGEELRVYGTDPFDPDIDGDLMPDPWEIGFGFDPLVWNDPDKDSDGDGLTDGQEAAFHEIVRAQPAAARTTGLHSAAAFTGDSANWSICGSSPFLADSDMDGVLDRYDIDPANLSDNHVSTDDDTVPVTLTIGDPSLSHSEMYALSVGPYHVYMPHVSSSSFMFSKTFRMPRGRTFQGFISALPDDDEDGDYSASVSGPGISLSFGGEDTHFNSGSIPFTVTTPDAVKTADVAAQPASRNPELADKADPVNVISGNVTLSLTDAAIGCPGVPLAFVRYYNSSTLLGGGPLGPGWTHGYEIRLGGEEQTVYQGVSGVYRRLYLPDGRTFAFRKSGDAFSPADDTDLRLEPADADGWRVCRPGGTGWTFDIMGRLAFVDDGQGNLVTLTYTPDAETGADYLSRIEHSNGQFISLSYTGEGQRGVFLTGLATADPSWSIAFAYDDSGRFASATRVTSAGPSFAEGYSYEAVGFCLTQRVDAAGATYNYSYTNIVRNGIAQRFGSASWLDGNAFLTRFQYHAGNVTNATRATAYWASGSSVASLFRWDTNTWRITSEVNEADGSGRTFAYDSGQNPVRETLFHNGVTSVVVRVFDGRHNVLREASALRAEPAFSDNAQFYEWHPDLALPVMTADASGVTNFFTWSDTGLLLSSRDAVSAVSFAYTANGQPAAVTNANGHATAFAYDALGYPSLTEPPVGPTSRTVFDSAGHLIESALPAPGGGWRATAFTNDTYGRVCCVTWPDGISESILRNAAGAVTSRIDRAGNRTALAWLPMNTPASVTRWLDAATPVTVAWSRDWQMNTLAVTDPMGRKVETYRLDAQDRVAAVTNLEGQSMAVSYLVGGLVSSVRRFDGVTVSNVYDSAGRVTRTLHNGAEILGTAYRANGQSLSASNTANTVSWSYDPAGRAVSEAVSPQLLTPNSSLLTYSYDPSGNPTNTNLSVESSAFNVERSFDPAERLSCQTTPAGAFTYSYGDRNGLAVCVSNAALTAENAYDILDRVTNMVYRNASATVVGSFAYQYDVRGLVTQKAGTLDGATATNTYAYDALGRLISADGVAYTYDLAGNRLTAGASSFTYSNNRLACVAHDTAGNITNMVRGGVTLALSWNTQGQLTSVSTNGVFAESYAYDPLGRRSSTTGGGGTICHIYDGAQCVVDVSSAGTPLRSYTWGQGLDNLLAVTVFSTGATNTYYAVKDHLGSVQALVDAQGQIVESYACDVWGNTTIRASDLSPLTSSQFGNRFMFQGREYSTATGFYNFRARWYAPTIGRWLSKDPIGLEGGLNLYVFCGNDPVNFTDPMGLCENTDNYHTPTTIKGILEEILRGMKLASGDISPQNEYDNMLSAAVQNAMMATVGGGNSVKPVTSGKASISAIKKSLTKVQELVGKLTKGKNGKFGAPQRGSPQKGYRLDMDPHPNAPPGSPETGPHINYWDWTNGKRGSGGISGSEPI